MEKIIVHDGISNEVFDFKTFEEAKEMILEEYVQENSIHPDIESVKIFKQVFETKVTETKPNFYKVEFEELEAQTIGQAEVLVIPQGELLPCPFCGGKPATTFIGNNHTKKRSVEIKCTECFTKQVTGAIRHDHKWCEEKAIETWNKRART